jgi:hypothetical protein
LSRAILSRRVASRVLVTAVAAAGVLAAAPGVSQATVHTTCVVNVSSTGDMCFYYRQSYNGSHSGSSDGASDYPPNAATQYQFLSAGDGQWYNWGNRNGSNLNGDRLCTPRLFLHVNQTGAHVSFSQYPLSGYKKAGSGLGALLNNARSIDWPCQ